MGAKRTSGLVRLFLRMGNVVLLLRSGLSAQEAHMAIVVPSKEIVEARVLSVPQRTHASLCMVPVLEKSSPLNGNLVEYQSIIAFIKIDRIEASLTGLCGYSIMKIGDSKI